MEYRGVLTHNKKQLFIKGPFKKGTNNIGEFLALVHGIALLKSKNKANIPIYSDSRIAMSWVKKKQCRTNLVFDASNKDLLDLIKRAEKWLEENTYNNPILKWETKAWGEIPADFGRK
jgi:ribonuclease HI